MAEHSTITWEPLLNVDNTVALERWRELQREQVKQRAKKSRVSKESVELVCAPLALAGCCRIFRVVLLVLLLLFDCILGAC